MATALQDALTLAAQVSQLYQQQQTIQGNLDAQTASIGALQTELSSVTTALNAAVTNLKTAVAGL
jgi:prefoldin subunit 5